MWKSVFVLHGVNYICNKIIINKSRNIFGMLQCIKSHLCPKHLIWVPLSMLATDPGSHPGLLSAPACPGSFWAGGLCAEIHWPPGHRSHHQPHRPVAVHWSWKEVGRSLGNSRSVSGHCLMLLYWTDDNIHIHNLQTIFPHFLSLSF